MSAKLPLWFKEPLYELSICGFQDQNGLSFNETSGQAASLDKIRRIGERRPMTCCRCCGRRGVRGELSNGYFLRHRPCLQWQIHGVTPPAGLGIFGIGWQVIPAFPRSSGASPGTQGKPFTDCGSILRNWSYRTYRTYLHTCPGNFLCMMGRSFGHSRARKRGQSDLQCSESARR